MNRLRPCFRFVHSPSSRSAPAFRPAKLVTPFPISMIRLQSPGSASSLPCRHVVSCITFPPAPVNAQPRRTARSEVRDFHVRQKRAASLLGLLFSPAMTTTRLFGQRPGSSTNTCTKQGQLGRSGIRPAHVTRKSYGAARCTDVRWLWAWSCCLQPAGVSRPAGALCGPLTGNLTDRGCAMHHYSYPWSRAR